MQIGNDWSVFCACRHQFFHFIISFRPVIGTDLSGKCNKICNRHFLFFSSWSPDCLLELFCFSEFVLFPTSNFQCFCFQNWLNSRDPDNQTLRAIFCLELKEEPKLYVAKTPVDDDLETARRKTLFSHFENLTGGLKSPFAKFVPPLPRLL